MAHHSDAEAKALGLSCTFEDVFGKRDDDLGLLIDPEERGFVIAAGQSGEPWVHRDYPNQGVCPIFGDDIPWKSVTVVFPAEHESAVEHWLIYVHGGGHERRKVLENGTVAIRSNYQAW